MSRDSFLNRSFGMTLSLLQGDCVSLLKDMPSNSVDLVLTSPPYNMNLRIRNGKYCSRQIVKEISTKYRNYSDNLSMEEYFLFNKKVISELLRVSDLVFYNMQMLTGNKPAFFRILGEFSGSIKEFIVWDKVVAQPAISEGVLNSQFEVLIVLQASSPESRRFERNGFDRGTLPNLWRIPRGKKGHKDHGASFPEQLAETVIQNFTKQGDHVMDPFMGTGTSGVVSVREGRRFTGIEIDEEYFTYASDRIRGTKRKRSRARRMLQPDT